MVLFKNGVQNDERQLITKTQQILKIGLPWLKWLK